MLRSASLSGSRCGRPGPQKQTRLAGAAPRAQRAQRWKGLLDEVEQSEVDEHYGSSPDLEAIRQSAEHSYRQTSYKYYAIADSHRHDDPVAHLRRKLDAVERELMLVSEEEYLASRPPAHASPRLQQPPGSINNVVLHPHMLHGLVEELAASLAPPPPAPAAPAPPKPQQQEQQQAPPSPAYPRLEGKSGGKPEGTGREILLQGFNWESWRHGWFERITQQSQEIADMGFTAIWLPPFTDSVSEQGYMPRDLYNLNSRYGSEEQLIRCVKSLQSHGIKVLGDAVLNHRCAQYQSSNGIWNQFGGKMSWDERAIVGDQHEYGGRGNRSSGESFGAAPNIDHSQDFVKRDLCEWMVWLRTHVGFDGWRLDFVKGFHGSHVKDYLEASAPDFVVGEYWDSLAYQLDGTPCHNQDAHRQRIVNWINAAGGLATAFDITTKGIMHAVFERCEYWRLKDATGKPPGLLGWWPSRSVTFLENHDTGSTQGHWRFPHHALEQGYVYLLTHPGTPTVFYDHLYEGHSHLRHLITRLIETRKRNDINCRSQVKILAAERDVYAAEIDSRLVMKIGPGDFEPDETYGIVDCGHCWTIWEKQA